MGLARISTLNLPFVNAHPFVSAVVAVTAAAIFAFQAVAQNPVVRSVSDCIGFYSGNLNKATSAAGGVAGALPAPAAFIRGFQGLGQFAESYGFYALKQGPGALQATARTLTDLVVDEQSSTGDLMDGAMGGFFSGGNIGKRWDMHAHLPPNPSPEELNFIFSTLKKRNVELLAVTSYGFGGADAATYEGFIDAAKRSGNYLVDERGFLSVLSQGGEQLVLLRAQEISTRQGFHVIVYGGSRRLGHKIWLEEVLSRADSSDIKIGAHPYLVDLVVNGSHIGMPVPVSYEQERYLSGLLESGLLDGIEVANPFAPMPLNIFALQMAAGSRVARDNNNGTGEGNSAANSRANSGVLFITGGSDAHFYMPNRSLGRVLGLTGIEVEHGAVDFSSEGSFLKTFGDAQRSGAIQPYSRFNSLGVWAPYMSFHLALCEKGIADANARRSP